MSKKPHRLSLLVFALFMLLSGNASANFDISLKSIDGSQHQLSEYIGHGKWVVLNIWGTRCPPCREEMPELVRFHDEYNDSNAIVVGIAIDFPSYGYAKRAQVASFADDYLIDFPILLSDASITSKLGLGRLEGLPTTYLIDPQGAVVGVQVGGITKKILEDFIDNYQPITAQEAH